MAPIPKDADGDDDSCTTLESSCNDSEALLAPTPIKEEKPRSEEKQEVTYSPATRTLNSLSQSHFIANREEDDENDQISAQDTKKANPIKNKLPWKERAQGDCTRNFSSQDMNQPRSLTTSNDTTSSIEGLIPCALEEDSAIVLGASNAKALNTSTKQRGRGVGENSEKTAQESEIHSRPIQKYVITKPGKLGVVISKMLIGSNEYSLISKVHDDSICCGILQKGDILCAGPDSVEKFMPYKMVHTLAETRPFSIYVARRADPKSSRANEVESNSMFPSPNSNPATTSDTGAVSLPSTQMLAEALLSLEKTHEPNNSQEKAFSSGKGCDESNPSQDSSNETTLSRVSAFDEIVHRYNFPRQLDPTDISNTPILYCKACKNTDTGNLDHHARCPKSPKFDEQRFCCMIQGYNSKCMACLEEFRYGNGKGKKHIFSCPRQTQTQSKTGKLKKKSLHALLQEGKQDFTDRKKTWAKIVDPPDYSSTSDNNIDSDDESQISLPEVLNSYDIRSNWIPYCDACNPDPGEPGIMRRRRYHHHQKCPKNPMCDTLRFQKMIDGYNGGCQKCRDEYQYGVEKPATSCNSSLFCALHNNTPNRRGKESQKISQAARQSTQDLEVSESEDAPESDQENCRRLSQKRLKGIQIGCKSCQYEMERGKKARHLRHHINCERSSFYQHPKSLSPSLINKHQEGLTMEKKLEKGVRIGCQSCIWEMKGEIRKAKRTRHHVQCERSSQSKKRSFSPSKVEKFGGKEKSPRQKRSKLDYEVYLSRLTKSEKMKLGAKMGCRSCIRELKTGNKNRHENHCVRSKSFRPEDLAKVISTSEIRKKLQLERSPLNESSQSELEAPNRKEINPLIQTAHLTKNEKMKLGAKMGCKSCIHEMKTGIKNTHDKRCLRSKSFLPESLLNTPCAKSVNSHGEGRTLEDSKALPISKRIIQEEKNNYDSVCLDVTSRFGSTKEKTKFLDMSVDITNVVFPFCHVCKNGYQTDQVRAHHALCPRHPHFTTSGALKKLERIRFGLKHNCPACEIEYNLGKLSDKAIRHNAACEHHQKKESASDKKHPNTKGKATNPYGNEKENDVLESSPAVRNRTFPQKAKSVTPDVRKREVFEGRKVRLDSCGRAIKPIWKSCANPWGGLGYHEDDVVISSVGLSHHEALLNDERFTVDPFAVEPSYKSTHFMPGEGTHTLKLSRDPIACVPWGIQVLRHDFGGACLVHSVDQNSPAVQARYVGSSVCSPLLVNDIILAINGKDIGGMTLTGFDIEMETSGAEMTLTISRYRFPSEADMEIADLQNNVWATLEYCLEDKRKLGWCELDLTSTVEQIADENRKYSLYQAGLDDASYKNGEIAVASSDSKPLVIPQVDELMDATSHTSDISSQSTEILDDGLDENGNPCAGCVCGEIHESPTAVFWIQCDSCDCWYNVSPACVGFDKEAAESIKRWTCHACPSTNSGDLAYGRE